MTADKTIRVLPSTKVDETLATELGLPPTIGSTELIFEIIRAVAWASTVGGRPVPSHVLADRATGACAPLAQRASESAMRPVVETAIDGLVAVGDLARLRGGEVMCTPGHCVDIPQDPQSFLIAGRPLRDIAEAERPPVAAHGPLRVIPADVATPFPMISFDQWARRPGEDLASWATDLIADQPMTSPPQSRKSAYGYYRPDFAQRFAKQSMRWDRHTDGYISGRYLARHAELTGGIEYDIVELKRGRVTGAAPCDEDTARRLMYGLDLLAGSPTRAQVRREKYATIVTVENPLPRSESRRLYADSSAISSRSWHLPRSTECAELTSLGIALMT